MESLFDHLADIFGSKFNLAFPDEDSEYGAKKAYSRVINKLDNQSLGFGLEKLVERKVRGDFKYLDISEVIAFIINPYADKNSVKNYWLEYNNRGVQTRTGLKWSNDAIAETSKRLGRPQFLIGGQEEFERVFIQVLSEMQAGAKFEQPIAIQKQDTKADKQARLEKSRKSSAYEEFKKNAGLL